MTDVEPRPAETGLDWAYAPAPESRAIVSLEERYGLYVGGEMVEPRSGEWFTTISPADEEPLAEVAQAGPEDVDAAVSAARDGFATWSELRPAERAKYLFRIARILQERSRELAVAESLDGGKPIKESRDVDLPLAAAHFFYHAGWADKLEYAFANRRPRPLGVAAQIIPWNFPLLMLAWKVAPALACGNSVVLKPAETTPLTALIFADVCRQAELPAGAVNIITGDGSTGAELVKHTGIDKVAFTGSTEVGKAIQRELAGRGVPHTLELGGKAANIVFDDCALDQAVEGIVNGIYFNQGHVCCAGSRLLVQESILEPLIGKLRARLATLRLGDPLDKNTDIGAINSRAQLDRIQELVASGEAEGAELFQPACELPERGFWFPPTVFTNVAQSFRIAQEEIFGPVLSVMTFRTPSEAVEKANNTAYGLSAGVWTREGLAHPLDDGAPPGRRRLGQHVQPVRPGVAVRRLQGVGLRPRGRPARPRGVHEVRRMSRLPVKKTYKLYIGGAFPRSESGRTFAVDGHNVALASRKDARDAVRAARAAFARWSGATAYNRGQVLYRLAEMMEARGGDLAAVCSGRDEVERSIDRVVWYAGWADKLAQALGGANAVAGPYFNFTVPEPTGVVATLAPDEPALEGLVSRVMPALVSGNVVVAVASEPGSLAAIELAEAAATSDMPGGALNILTGRKEELGPILAGHADVNAIDLTGANGDVAELERLAAGQRQADRARDACRREPVGDRAAGRDEDRLAPGRRLIQRGRGASTPSTTPNTRCPPISWTIVPRSVRRLGHAPDLASGCTRSATAMPGHRIAFSACAASTARPMPKPPSRLNATPKAAPLATWTARPEPFVAAVRRDEARDQPQLAMRPPGESADHRLGGDPCRRGDRPGGGCLKVTAHSANRRGAVLV